MCSLQEVHEFLDLSPQPPTLVTGVLKKIEAFLEYLKFIFAAKNVDNLQIALMKNWEIYFLIFGQYFTILTIVTNGTSSKLRLSRRDNILFWPQLKSAQGFTLVTLLLWKKLGNLRICVVGKDIRVMQFYKW